MPSLVKNRLPLWQYLPLIVFGSAILYIVAQFLGALLVLPFTGFVKNANAEAALLWLAIFAAFILLLVWVKQLIGFKWREIGVQATKARYLLVVPLVFVVYGAISQGLLLLAERFSNFDPDQVQELGLAASGTTNLIYAFVALVIITPLFEELVFRGVLFHGLRRRVPFATSAVLSSLLFAVAHGQLNVALDTFVLGMMLCLLTEKSKSLIPAMALHALKNLLAFGVVFLGWFN